MNPETDELAGRARVKLDGLKVQLKQRMRDIRGQMGEEQYREMNPDGDDDFDDDDMTGGGFGGDFIKKTEETLDSLQKGTKADEKIEEKEETTAQEQIDL